MFMSNINDYLLWRGDLSFKNSAYNEIDDMILARFSYMPFHKITFENDETIETLSKKLRKFKNSEFSYNGDKNLITNLGKSIRFKNLKVTDFEANTDKKAETQFSAITIHLDDKTMYISFNGTDDSIVGWKEDFNLSFMENIPAQIQGKDYLIKQAQKYDKRIRIGGHSKGGNIAIYSGATAPLDVQDKIDIIKNYDGPGFSETFVKTSGYKKILPKTFSFIPQSSIIGRILEHKETFSIVKSIEKGIYQHDIYSWQVLGTKLTIIDKVTNDSEFFDKTITTWLKETDPKQRKIFIDSIFELFNLANVNTLKDFSSAKIKSLNVILKSYNNIDENEKAVIKDMIGKFLKIAGNNIFEAMKKK